MLLFFHKAPASKKLPRPTMSIPETLKYDSSARELHLLYGNGHNAVLSAELLRVYSPSAEVRGHEEGEAVLVTGKSRVGIKAIEPVGNYGVKIRFDDGHDTGIYSWSYLQELTENRNALWLAYVAELERRGLGR